MSDEIMIERVARAIWDCHPNVLRKEQAYELVSVAIKAMREPTKKMADEAEWAEPFTFDGIWKAAIDSILND
jgi:hypothetical protein